MFKIYVFLTTNTDFITIAVMKQIFKVYIYLLAVLLLLNTESQGSYTMLLNLN